MTTYLNVHDIEKRVTRLEKLGRDLADELAVIEDGNDPLNHEERRAYVSAILDAVSGMAAARDVLAYVRQRLASEDAAAA